MAKFRTIEGWAVFSSVTKRPIYFKDRASARRHVRIWNPLSPAPVKVRIQAVDPSEREKAPARRYVIAQTRRTVKR